MQNGMLNFLLFIASFKALPNSTPLFCIGAEKHLEGRTLCAYRAVELRRRMKAITGLICKQKPDPQTSCRVLMNQGGI